MSTMEFPSELQCPLCKDLLVDAVMMPCCAGSACEDCARTGITGREEKKCPMCEEVAKPEDLIPYRLFRDKVDKFRTRTGYTKPSTTPPSVQLSRPTLPDIVLPTLLRDREQRPLSSYSPRGTSPPRPSTLKSSPLRSPGTPLPSLQNSSRVPSPGTPYSHYNRQGGHDTPTTSPEYLRHPASGGPTLLPPSHILAPPTPVYPATHINPSEDPLAAFEAAMRQLDAKKAGRGRQGPPGAAPPKDSYRGEKTRSRSRERIRGFRQRDYSPYRRPGGYSGDSSLRGNYNRSHEPGPDEKFRRHDVVSVEYRERRKERYVTDIPPETREERRDRERFERELSRRESYLKERQVVESRNMRRNERSNVRLPSSPHSGFDEEVKVSENKAAYMENRTPSLSPDLEREEKKIQIQDYETNYECGRKEDRHEMMKGERRKYSGRKSEADDEYGRERSKTVASRSDIREQGRTQDVRVQGRCSNREIREQDASGDILDYDEDKEEIERDYEDCRDLKEIASEKNKEIEGLNNQDVKTEIVGKLKCSEDLIGINVLQDNSVLKEDKEDGGQIGMKEARLMKEKKSKKSKKKSKKKVKHSEYDEHVKKRKKKKKRQKAQPEYFNEINGGGLRPLVPYDEADDTKAEESSEPQEIASPVATKFVSSFKETDSKCNKNLLFPTSKEKTEELLRKSMARLGMVERASSVQGVKSDRWNEAQDSRPPERLVGVESMAVSSKWEREDNLDADNFESLEHPRLENHRSKGAKNRYQEPTASVKHESAGPQNMLRKALANIMEKDNAVKDKERKTHEECEPDVNISYQLKKKAKKKKKKKVVSENESSDEEIKHKRRDRKKKGLLIPEKTLKKLLKKNITKKKALEKLIAGGGEKEKRRKLKEESGREIGNEKAESFEEDINFKKRDKVRKSVSRNEGRLRETTDDWLLEENTTRSNRFGGKDDRKDRKDEGREVKSSREGCIQVKLSCSRQSISLTEQKTSLTSTVQAKLLRMAGQGSGFDRGERAGNSPLRKSVKDRLGPVSRGASSPVNSRCMRDKDREISRKNRKTRDRKGGRNKNLDSPKVPRRLNKEDGIERTDEGRKKFDVKDKFVLEPVPADLQAWAEGAGQSHSSKPQERSKPSGEEEGGKSGRQRGICPDDQWKTPKEQSSLSARRGVGRGEH